MNRESLLRAAARIPLIGPTLLMAPRALIAARYFRGQTANVARWLIRSRELANFTYDLTELNQRYLAAMISGVTRQPIAQIEVYIREIQQDDALRAHVRKASEMSTEAGVTDSHRVDFGRRIGWYAVVRALKPKVVIETGVDKGLGACVLCAALLHNADDGKPGHYYGTDINPLAGYLLRGPYETVGTMLYGDSVATLQHFDRLIDVFINDSDHSADYERLEYQTIQSKLAEGAIVLGDNSHESSALYDFAAATGRQFTFFSEKPANHWYPGAGIGIAYAT